MWQHHSVNYLPHTRGRARREVVGTGSHLSAQPAVAERRRRNNVTADIAYSNGNSNFYMLTVNVVIISILQCSELTDILWHTVQIRPTKMINSAVYISLHFIALEERCEELGLPECEDNVIVGKAKSQVSQVIASSCWQPARHLWWSDVIRVLPTCDYVVSLRSWFMSTIRAGDTFVDHRSGVNPSN